MSSFFSVFKVLRSLLKRMQMLYKKAYGHLLFGKCHLWYVCLLKLQIFTLDGKDAIETAVQNNHFKFLNRLFGFGANPKYLSVEAGDTPIHAALYIALERDEGNTHYLFSNLFF